MNWLIWLKKIKNAMKFNKKFKKKSRIWKKERDLMNNHPKKRIKVFRKVKKLNVLTIEVYDTLLLIVLAPKISKSLCRIYEVTQTMKKVIPQLLKM